MNLRPSIAFTFLAATACPVDAPVLPEQGSSGGQTSDETADPSTGPGNPGQDTTAGTDEGTTSTTGEVDTSGDESGSTTTGMDFCGNSEPVLAFEKPLILDVGGSPFELAVGDFIGDDAPDMAYTDGESEPPLIHIMRGQGELAGFVAANAIPMVEDASGVEAGNLDGDSRPELVTLDRNVWSVYEADPLDEDSMVMLATGMVGLERTRGNVLADVLGDDALELVVNSGLEDDVSQISIVSNLLGMPTEDTFTGGDDSNFIAVADVNGDGRADIIAPHNNFGDAPVETPVDVLINTSRPGAPSFDRTPLPAGPRTYGVDTGDLNGDGIADFVVGTVGQELFDGMPDPLNIWLGQRGATPAAQPDFIFDDGVGALRLADFDCDGNLDLVVGGTQGIQILPGDGKGSFSTEDSIALEIDGDIFGDIVVHDMTLDGRLDFMVTVLDEGTIYFFEAS
ncbi:MAG: VCBS repeat-containing protein [Myxococcota bacterium]